MPRTANNPNKQDILAPDPSVFDQAKVIIRDENYRPKYTLAILTHYDSRSPYHAHRIPVVELCVASMTKGIKDYELLIFDNGSTADFRKKLKTFNADILVLSPNLGKQTAQQKMVELARGEIFCFTDDDVYFYPGWLDQHMQIINTFPDRPLLVSGAPQRTAFQWGAKTNLEFARKAGGMTIGRMISAESERMYAVSVGQNPTTQALRTVGLKDYMIEYNGCKAWMHAHHMQLVARRKHLLDQLPPSHYLVDNAREWDMKMDVKGFMRLTTIERTCLHIGNELQGDVKLEGKHDPN
jgi:glycosyltransferase involved in cell wall biosynthesis